MHQSVLEFVNAVLYPEEVAGKAILEVGSANINGSVRPLVERYHPRSYTGVDLATGPGVDMVAPEGVESLPYNIRADVVVSCEMLEHAQDWKRAFKSMCDRAVHTLILTARGPGFPYHNPPDYHRFRAHDLFRAALANGLYPVVCKEDPQVPGVFLKAVRPGYPAIGTAPEPHQ